MPTLVQPFQMRSKISEEAGVLRIVIPMHRTWVALFLLFWLTLWTYGGLDIGGKLIRHFELFNFVWMCFWIVAECSAIFFLLRMLGGTDVIEATGSEFTLKQLVFGIGRTRIYSAREMRDLRFQPEVGSGRSHSTSRIAFNYGAKTIRFGENIDEAEAAELIRLIRNRSNIESAPSSAEGATKFWSQS